MSDYLTAANDPRVRLLVMAQEAIGTFGWGHDPDMDEGAVRWLPNVMRQARHGRMDVTEEQARALLDAVAAWDAIDHRAAERDPESRQADERTDARSALDAAVRAIVGDPQ